MTNGGAVRAQPLVDYLRTLNPEQRAAVEHFQGPLLVLAGAGSGKTRVLTVRIGHLIRRHGVPPERIMAVTFTNKAAGEMRERIRMLLGMEPAGMWMGTFHGFGARLLRRHAPLLGWSPNFTIFDAEENLRQVRRTQERLNISPRRWHPEAVRAAISAAKNRLISPQRYADEIAVGSEPFATVVNEIYTAYDESLKEQNAFDFDDLLVKPVELLESYAHVLESYRQRYAFVLVDEYQDTNHAQYRLVDLIACEHRNLMVVGDDDQSIYGWRGADIRNILEFEQSFPGAAVVRLEQNYRSTKRILEAANEVIRQNLRRKEKRLRTENPEGEPLTLMVAADEGDEANCIADEIEAGIKGFPELMHRSFAILYRTNAQSRALEEALRRRAIPYQIVGGLRFYERREIMDVLAYLRLISNPRDVAAFDRVVNYPRRGIGDVSQARLLAWASAHGISPLEAAMRAAEVPELPAASAPSLVRFAELLQRYSALALHLPVEQLLSRLVEELGLLKALREEGLEGEDRAENVQELIAGAAEFDADGAREELAEGEGFTPLDLFLQRVALVTDADRHDPESDAVTLMTLHNAKGLEFTCVFISGVEEGLFPLSRSYEAPELLEEERRLFYVGLTRAKDKVYVTYAKLRRRAGDLVPMMRSSFVEAIPRELLQERRSPRLGIVGEPDWTGARGNAAARRTQREVGVETDYELNQDLPRFVKGERVLHLQFGAGRVVGMEGFGRDLKVVVDFDAVGRKKLMVRYASLQRDYDA
ncbi:MAG: UvrD-helicase domain-containing protein [Gemmatimonadetes bacterium]|nr:UvrD-helicase domain-containing protein [Gemmatimonadota bacterium]